MATPLKPWEQRRGAVGRDWQIGDTQRRLATNSSGMQASQPSSGNSPPPAVPPRTTTTGTGEFASRCLTPPPPYREVFIPVQFCYNRVSS